MPMHSPNRICTFLLTILKGKISIIYSSIQNENSLKQLNSGSHSEESFIPDLSRRDAHVGLKVKVNFNYLIIHL